MPEPDRQTWVNEPGSSGLAELVLVRHGESVGNVADRAAIEAEQPRLDIETRDADVELSDTGRQQAEAVARHIAGLPEDEWPTAVVSSPYARARQTAEIATGELGLEVVVDERLRERDLGAFDGLTWIGVQQEYPQESERRARVGKFYFRPPGGESWADVVLRVRQVVLELQERYAGERLWVFSHQAVIMSFRVALEGLTEQVVLQADKETPVANCSMTVYRRGEQGLGLAAYGDTTAVDRSRAEVTHEESHAEDVDEGVPDEGERRDAAG
jgi:broad specificity phosphatase PhoE